MNDKLLEHQAEALKLVQEALGQPKWWHTHSNLVVLTSWMADRGWQASQIAYAVEKPWKYATEFRSAVAVQAHEVECDGHVVMPANVDETTWFCTGPKDGPTTIGVCAWKFDAEEES